MNEELLLFGRRFRVWWLVMMVMLVGLVLRGWEFGSVPKSLYWEEVALGYDAYSIFTTGKDHHGNPWPIVAFESYGDWKPPGYFYALAPLVGTLGLQAWVVRLPAFIFGLGTLLLTYGIGKRLYDSPIVGLCSMFMLAVMPWHIHFSRVGYEVTMATFFWALGIYLLLWARERPWIMIGAACSLVITMYTYHGMRVLSPLTAGVIGLMYLGDYKKHWRLVVMSLIMAIVMLWPMVKMISSPQVSQRFAETSMFSVSSAVEKTNLWRAEDGDGLLGRMIHHRYWYWGKEILSNMSSYVSLDFLFVDGDENLRHQTGFVGLLYWWMLLPLVVGFVYGWRDRRKITWLLVLLLMICALPAALTKTNPHTLRFLPASVILSLVMGWGCTICVSWWKQSRYRLGSSIVIGGLVFGSIFVYMYDYLTVYPLRSDKDWQDGYEQLVNIVETLGDRPVYVTRDYGRPYMYWLFYTQADPEEVQQFSKYAPKDQAELLEWKQIHFGEVDESNDGVVVTMKPWEGRDPVVRVINSVGKEVFYIYE